MKILPFRRVAATLIVVAWLGSGPVARAQPVTAIEATPVEGSAPTAAVPRFFEPAEPVFESLPGTFASSGAHFTIREPLVFIDSRGYRWVAPANTISDGVSIPRLWMSIIGAPTEATFMKAAMLHDAYCAADNREGASYHARSTRDVNRMFHEALRAGGTAPTKAWVMHFFVGCFGPKNWDMNERPRPTAGLPSAPTPAPADY